MATAPNAPKIPSDWVVYNDLENMMTTVKTPQGRFTATELAIRQQGGMNNALQGLRTLTNGHAPSPSLTGQYAPLSDAINIWSNIAPSSPRPPISPQGKKVIAAVSAGNAVYADTCPDLDGSDTVTLTATVPHAGYVKTLLDFTNGAVEGMPDAEAAEVWVATVVKIFNHLNNRNIERSK